MFFWWCSDILVVEGAGACVVPKNLVGAFLLFCFVKIDVFLVDVFLQDAASIMPLQGRLRLLLRPVYHVILVRACVWVGVQQVICGRRIRC